MTQKTNTPAVSTPKGSTNDEFFVDWKNKDVKQRIRDVLCKGATEDEFSAYVAQARSFGLNPFIREIHFVKYGGSAASIVIGYEVYLKRAERTGLLDGWEVVTNKNEAGEVVSATITIHRKDRKHPFVWTVERDEFDPGPPKSGKKTIWMSKPSFMTKKVAIGQGFRLGFPEELGGMPYLPEELPQTQDYIPPTEKIVVDEKEVYAKPTVSVPEVVPETVPETKAKAKVERKPAAPSEEETKVESKPEPEKEHKEKAPTENVEVFLKKDKIENIGSAFSKFSITIEELETITDRPRTKWTEKVREWLEEKWFALDDGELDKDQIMNVQFTG